MYISIRVQTQLEQCCCLPWSISSGRLESFAMVPYLFLFPADFFMETRLEGLLAALLLVGDHVRYMMSNLSENGKIELQTMN